MLVPRLNLTPALSTYTHAPYWLVPYSYQKGTFRVAVSGATGKILMGELPVTRRYRLKKWLTSMVLLIGSGLLFQVLPYLLWAFLQGNSSSDSDIWMIPVFVGAAAIALWGGSIAIMGSALKYEVQVNEEGKERGSSFSLRDLLKKLEDR